MSDKKPMPADGGGIEKGKADGISGTPGSAAEGEVHGRAAGGESGGGAYPNPNSGNEAAGSSSPEHGGQSEIAYYGGANPNATTEGGTLAEAKTASRVSATPTRDEHEVVAGEQRFSVVEDSGVAAAEATHKVGKDSPGEKLAKPG